MVGRPLIDSADCMDPRPRIDGADKIQSERIIPRLVKTYRDRIGPDLQLSPKTYRVMADDVHPTYPLNFWTYLLRITFIIQIYDCGYQKRSIDYGDHQA